MIAGPSQPSPTTTAKIGEMTDLGAGRDALPCSDNGPELGLFDNFDMCSAQVPDRGLP